MSPDELRAAEMARVGRGGKSPDELVGLSLSGGGIRSASFCLGVVQALEESGKLEQVDYLSSVSGGGYTGSALTWLKRMDLAEVAAPLAQIAQERGRTGQSRMAVVLERFADYLRSRGNYLDPNQRLNAMALVGVVLRTMLLNLTVYCGLLLLAFYGAYKLGVDLAAFGLGGAAFVSGVLAALWLVFGIMTGVSGTPAEAGSGQGWSPCAQVPNPAERRVISRYRLRTFIQVISGQGLVLALLLALVGSLPFMQAALDEVWQQGILGAFGVLGGAAQALAHYLKGKQGKQASGPLTTGMALWASAGVALYGLMLLSDALGQSLAGAPTPWQAGLAVALALVVFALGRFANVNLVTPHRMYRDRLMEAFLPSPKALLSKRSEPAACADRSPLAFMCDGVAPFHILNTNLVLVDSKDTLYRGRGGDNFVLSPAFCGGDATGWAEARKFAGTHADSLTLATAMAISGAAVNAHSGPDGQGPMRSALVSMLLTLFGLQLGYWVSGPGAAKPAVPTFFRPALKGLFGSGFHEHARFLQLSDGGHFENLGLYELIRRKLGTIVMVDAGADPSFQFGDLGNAIERVYADFGAKVGFGTLGDLVPHEGADYPLSLGLAKRGWVEGIVTYADGTQGRLYYVKATMVTGLPESIYAYKGGQPSFPHQTTADQFFDEGQLEAYRRLGFELASTLVSKL